MMIFNTSYSLVPLSPLWNSFFPPRMLPFYSHNRAWKIFLQLCKGNSKVGLKGNSQKWVKQTITVWGRIFIATRPPKVERDAQWHSETDSEKRRNSIRLENGPKIQALVWVPSCTCTWWETQGPIHTTVVPVLQEGMELLQLALTWSQGFTAWF